MPNYLSALSDLIAAAGGRGTGSLPLVPVSVPGTVLGGATRAADPVYDRSFVAPGSNDPYTDGVIPVPGYVTRANQAIENRVRANIAKNTVPTVFEGTPIEVSSEAAGAPEPRVFEGTPIYSIIEGVPIEGYTEAETSSADTGSKESRSSGMRQVSAPEVRVRTPRASSSNPTIEILDNETLSLGGSSDSETDGGDDQKKNQGNGLDVLNALALLLGGGALGYVLRR